MSGPAFDRLSSDDCAKLSACGLTSPYGVMETLSYSAVDNKPSHACFCLDLLEGSFGAEPCGFITKALRMTLRCSLEAIQLATS